MEPCHELKNLVLQNYDGIGLGLAVSRKLAEANSGHIEVESKPGKGSIIPLVLPIHEEEK